MQEDGPRFPVGQLVAHKQDGYRGVVAGWDPVCRADEGWYAARPAPAARNQAWYHVLVHGGRTAYVAEEDLEAYAGGEQVFHPLVRELFESFGGGRYHPRRGVRYSAPW